MARLRPAVARLARHRLLQFVLGGGALLAAAPAPRDAAVVELDGRRLDLLIEQTAQRRGLRQPSAALREEVLAQVATDELLVREARRLGLDQDDAILRRRLIQKALFLAEDLGGASRRIEDDELRAYFADHRDDYQLAARVRFEHIFSSEQAPLARELERRGRGAPALVADQLGAPREVDADEPQLIHELGAAMLATLRAAPTGAWLGPVRSKLGFHLIRVDARVPARRASYEEVADRLRLDVLIARRQLAVERFLASARARYRVALDGAPLTPPRGAPRTAAHYAASVED
jgi:peptidyl-prolyl cis-trans isomerase C